MPKDVGDAGEKDTAALLEGGSSTRKSGMELEQCTDESETKAGRLAQVRELVVWFGTLTVASTILTVANKAIMLKFRYANMVLLLQSLLSAGVLIAAKATGRIKVNPITTSQVQIFLVSSILKVLQVVTSLLALPLVAIATVMVFRNLAIVITALIDRFFFGSRLNSRCICALVLVLLGSLVYTGFDVNYSPVGYMWLAINTVLYVISVIYNKVFQTRLQEAKTQTAQGNALIEQSWMCVWGVGFAQMGGELTSKMATDLFAMSTTTFWLFIATGLAAPVIGTAYAKCFAIASPTTVTVAATVNKCVSIVIATFAFGTILANSQMAGLALCVFAGAWYGEEQKKAKMAGK